MDFDGIILGEGKIYHRWISRSSYPAISISAHPVFLISIYSPSVSSHAGFGRSDEKRGAAKTLSGSEKIRKITAMCFIVSKIFFSYYYEILKLS